MNIHLLHKQPRLSAEARILNYLKKKGEYGAFGHELAHPSVGALAWHRRITDLRVDGHNIQSVRISGGNWKYYLSNEQ